ncbi:MAG: acyltransferase family protein, partial [Lachnospiraceae bacterium]|nr:acyltransferase family protein [Lachnospiraceae bacterium]
MGDLKEKQQRMTGPDIVRTVAAFFVVAVHFYLSCGYYQTPMVGKKMFIMSCARWLFMPCVPLYMMLTGFFKSKKKISKDHYMSLVPILVAYVIISVIKVFVANHFYGKINFFKDTMIRLTDYSFAWYVGMYICMILLIPFLNILWEGLKSDKEKYILLLSLIAICSVSTVVPVIIPKYFQMLYPIMYYY